MTPTAPAAGSHSTRRKKDAAETEFHLTIPVTSITMISPASLRSDRDRHRVGISARDQIGITDHLHRNQQKVLRYQKIHSGSKTTANAKPAQKIGPFESGAVD